MLKIAFRKEYNKMKSNILGKISFWLAVSTWFSAGIKMVGLPEFG